MKGEWRMLKVLNLSIRFILEVMALVSLGYWGFKINAGSVLKMSLGIGIPLITATIWGVFGSPKAIWKVSNISKWILLFTIYILSTLALFTSGKKHLAIAFIVCAVINSFFMYIWDQ